MLIQFLLWSGLAVVGALSALNTRNGHAMSMALVLVAIAICESILMALYGIPDGMRLFPLVDFAGGLFAFAAYLTDRKRWLRYLVALFGIQLVAHGIFAVYRERGFEHEALLPYIVALNTTFALQLVCVGFPGATNAAEHIRDWLRPGLHHRGPT